MKRNPEELLRIRPFVFWQQSVGLGCKTFLLLLSGKKLAAKTANARKTDSHSLKKAFRNI